MMLFFKTNKISSKVIIIIIVIIFIIAFLAWLFIESSKPLPGTKIADLGRGHVPIGEKVDYNSNPPTSGKHFGEWIRAGVYSEPKDDRNLVHSLEHGYVIMSYNCGRKLTLIPEVFAHGLDESVFEATESATASALPNTFNSEDCHKLVDQLTEIYEKKGKARLIVIPRPNLDSRIALAAWNYLDKFDTFDEARIEKFIDAHLNMGPEKTME